ncbi:MAG: S-methyl-5-thioribose-1-phosphate isomerase [Deltaproteobacteria bacterium]|nr:MAG: S-methyl-5-thioribose-1-phosphate isomerase [Deltaproteobacteria bacterium]
MKSTITPIRRDDAGHVVMLDQRLLPFEEVYLTFESGEAVAQGIRDMVIRGAPAIGVAAAMGLALGARRLAAEGFGAAFAALCDVMAASRPTAVNLFWAIDRMKALVEAHVGDHASLLDALDAEAERVYAEDIAICQAIGGHGAPLVPEEATVLTHCNTGGLATAGWGTALGVVRSAVAAGKRVAVFADETRPYLQGSRLTAWECLKDGIDVTVLADGAAGFLLASGRIDLAIVGADRIARNGDTANKIGTYMVATLCARHGVPFYIAAPTSTVDLQIPDGAAIPIEERPAEEVTGVFGKPIAPIGVKAFNPSFDVTPAELIAGIVTEHGVARAPYEESLPALVELGARVV